MKLTVIRVLLSFWLIGRSAGRLLDAGELTITRVFGPEVPTGPYKHPACMTELKNGDLYLVYYGGCGRVRHRHGGLRLAAQEGRDPVDASQADCARPVPLGRQRRHLGSPRRRRLAVLRRPLRRDLVDLAAPVQGLARQRRDLVGCLGALARRGGHGPRPADRAQ